jgi:membrane fusion protein (multidrug efflux system)
MAAGPSDDRDDEAEPSDQDNDQGGDGDAGSKDAKPRKGLLQRPVLLIVGALILVVAIVGGVLYWLHARRFESTDDAFIDTHIVRLAPQIAGRVTQVLVDDNQQVQAGQPMVVIDSADAETRVAQAQASRSQAEAQVADAKVQIDVAQAAYQQAQAQAAAAAATADNAARDLARYQILQRLNPAAVAPQQLDQALSVARQTAADYQAARRTVAQRAQQIRAARTQVTSGQDQVNAAPAQLNQAGINLGYSRIVAPVSGHVAQKTVALGNYVEPGTEMLAIVPNAIWITANFKETQLTLMRAGQKVKVHVDACGADDVEGHVDSIEHGAGQAFAVLPPENATGNFVKVVQRVPVKIVLDRVPPDCLIGPGMSVEPQVTVR